MTVAANFKASSLVLLSTYVSQEFVLIIGLSISSAVAFAMEVKFTPAICNSMAMISAGVCGAAETCTALHSTISTIDLPVQLMGP